MFVMTPNDRPGLAGYDEASDRRPCRRANRCTRCRKIEQFDVDNDAFFDLQRSSPAAGSHAFVQPFGLVRKIIAVHQPHYLCRELFPLVLCHFKNKGKTIRRGSRDRAFESADLFKIDNDPLAGLGDLWRDDRRSADRNVFQLRRCTRCGRPA